MKMKLDKDPMTEAKAREVLGTDIQPDNSLHNSGVYTHWNVKYPYSATLDGDFSALELRALAWWMEHHTVAERI